MVFESNYSIPFFETSAKTGKNVEEVFITMARLAIKYHNKV